MKHPFPPPDRAEEAQIEAELLARWPHLARVAPNWEALERRAAGLPPRPPPALVAAVLAILVEHEADVLAALRPLIRAVILEALGERQQRQERDTGRAYPPLPGHSGHSEHPGRNGHQHR